MKRCNYCKKKQTLQFDCKCLNSFCLNCLPWYLHNCTFDYKKTHTEHLKKNNNEVKSHKVDDI
jgi:hypothetical protein